MLKYYVSYTIIFAWYKIIYTFASLNNNKSSRKRQFFGGSLSPVPLLRKSRSPSHPGPGFLFNTPSMYCKPPACKKNTRTLTLSLNCSCAF